MSRFITIVAGASARHAWLVLATWVLLAAALVAGSAAVGRGVSDSIAVPGSDSAAAEALTDQDGSDAGRNSLVLAADDALTSDENRAVVDDVVANLEQASGAEIANPLDNPQAATAGRTLSTDQQALYLSFAGDPDQLGADWGVAIDRAADPAREAGLIAAFGGELGRELDPGSGHLSEVVGIAAAIVILTITLGSALAMLLPVVAGLLAVASGVAIIYLISNVTAVPSAAPTIATMIGLGVGIDYSLFLVARYRRALADGVDPVAAVAVTASTSGTAVAFAGATVAMAICGLAITGVDFVSWLGFSTAIVVAIVLAASMTLTPALLSLLGVRLRERTRGPRGRGRPQAGSRDLEDSGWARFAGAVTRRPVVVTVVSVILLTVLAIPMVFLELGQSSAGSRAEGTHQRTYYDATAEHFGAGSNGRLNVVVGLKPSATSADDPRLLAVTEMIVSGTDAAFVSPPRLLGPAATIAVTPREEPNAPSTAALLDTIRAQVAADPALEAEGTTVHVGGGVAVRIDLADRISKRLPWLIGAVVAAAALLLAVAFRSVLLPIKAAAMNLVSIGAAYGVVVLVFQWGHGAGLIGLDGPVPIDSYVPMMLFAVLFGLSMDYEVFLLSAIRDHYTVTGDTTASIRLGLAETGRIITSAALIMVTVFSSFVLVDDPTIKIFGVGLSVAVVIDATIVRCLLVPALMTLMGRWNWWWPRSLDRLLPRAPVAVAALPTHGPQLVGTAATTTTAARQDGAR